MICQSHQQLKKKLKRERGGGKKRGVLLGKIPEAYYSYY
jgi:hypothetical protein